MEGNSVTRRLGRGRLRTGGPLFTAVMLLVTTAVWMPAASAAVGNITTVASGFNAPIGIAIDDEGNLFIADSGNHAIRKLDTSGMVTTVAGTFGLAGPPPLLNTPAGVATDSSGKSVHR